MKDLFINYATGLGIPKIVFKIATASSKYNGAAAITSRLKDISMETGMEEGIGVFVFMGILFFQLSNFLQAQFYKKKIEKDRLQLKLKNTDETLAQIDTYFISNSLRKKLKTDYFIPNY